MRTKTYPLWWPNWWTHGPWPGTRIKETHDSGKEYRIVAADSLEGMPILPHESGRKRWIYLACRREYPPVADSRYSLLSIHKTAYGAMLACGADAAEVGQ